MGMKKCKECRTEFSPKNSKGIFCSLACRQKDYRKNKNKEFESYRKAVSEMPKTEYTNQTEAPQLEAPKKTSIARGIGWYVKTIAGLEFEQEYRDMTEMINGDETLTKKQREDLLLSMKTPKI